MDNLKPVEALRNRLQGSVMDFQRSIPGLRTGHLFAGAGGGILADLILGHEPIFAVENDPYACQVLRERFDGLSVIEDDIRRVDYSAWIGRVDCLHAGFPCQDISAAGKGVGITGERSGLFREVLRAADVLRPRYLFLENSPMLVSRGLGVVLGALAASGYDARWTVLAAADVGAPHQRKRWWCLCWWSDLVDADSVRQLQPQGGQPDERGRPGYPGAAGRGSLAHAPRQRRRQTREDRRDESSQRPGWAGAAGNTWWSVEPGMGRVADGVANRAHRVRCLGNGQVPLCAAAAWILLGGPVEPAMIGCFRRSPQSGSQPR